MTLCNERRTVGNLALMCDIMDHEPQYGSDCELIVISEAKTLLPEHVAKRGWPVMSFKKDKKLRYHMLYEGGMWRTSFYNVMWIEWVGDVAERRGLGVVLKEAWDALQPEIKESSLG